MKKTLLATSAMVAMAGLASAQNLTIGGFVEFQAVFGENYDLERTLTWADPGETIIDSYNTSTGVRDLDFGVDARLNFDYSNSTKSGLEYGAHFELDLYQSDTETLTTSSAADYYTSDYYTAQKQDFLTGDYVQFNDAYVFINSALGNVKLGDTGDASEASNQLNVPYLVGALERDHFSVLEAEQVFYSNSFVGVDFEASVDDDSNWSLGVGYSADVGGVTVDLGLTVQDETMAGSLGMTAGGLSAGVNYAMEEVGATTEYVAAGVGYTMGALSVGTGVETEIRHANVSGEEYETNYFVGASYELADGLTVNVGVANLDSDSANNTSAVSGGSIDNFAGGPFSGYSGKGLSLGENEGRSWSLGASVKVAF